MDLPIGEEKVGESSKSFNQSDDSEAEIVIRGRIQHVRAHNLQREHVGEPPVDSDPIVRRSTHNTRGTHRNPFRLPHRSQNLL